MITVAWDIDDVLNDLMYRWLTDKWLPEHPGCQASFARITENTPERIINADKEEYYRSLDDFRLSVGYAKLKPDAQILAWFKKYGDRARHIAVTSVPVKAAHVSAGWVMKNFGRWIRGFSFIPSLRAGERIPEYDLTKADYLRWLKKADILVEDNERNIREAQKLGIKGILIKRPWNRGGLPVRGALAEINKLL